MRIQLAQTDGTLPFIDELPGFGIGQLEGYNGVGKSLTVSVLEICAGSRPPMSKRAWEGLCDGMGCLTVTATDVNDATELRWVLDGARLRRTSDELDERARPQLGWFVEVSIDGQPAQSLDEIRRLFAVERLNGDVGLIEQLAGRVDMEVRDIDEAGGRLLGSQKLERADVDIGELRDLVGELSVDRIADRASVCARRRAERKAAEEVLGRAVARRDRVDVAVKLGTRLEEIKVRGSELDTQIDGLDVDIAALGKRREKVSEELQVTEAAAGASAELRDELARASKSYKTATTRLGNVKRDLAEASQIAGLDDGDDPAARRVVLEQQLEQLRVERVNIDAGPAVINLIDTIHTPLARASASGLADQSLLSASSRTPGDWTVREVSDALVERRDELRELPSPQGAVRVDEAIGRLARQVAALDDVKTLRAARNKAAERQAKTLERSSELSEQLDKSTSDQLDKLRGALRGFDDELSRLGGQRTVLVYRRDALGAPQERDALAGQLVVVLQELELTAADVGPAHAEALRVAEQERDAFVEVRDIERRAVADHERDLADLRRTAEALRDERFAWVAGSAVRLPAGDQTLEEQLDALRKLQRRVRHADERLTGFRALFPGLGASLVAVAEQLRGRTARASIRKEVTAWLDGVAASWFDDEAVRAALLGPDSSDVSVDLANRQVSWKTQDERRTKPIEGLSSGQRAFAFTQARLAVLQQQAGTVANRLIALDEFGAFVSSNRIRDLAEYLQRWRDKHPSDQILVILPANQDYAALARASEGEQAERFARMARRLHEHEWFVEEFVAP